MAPSKLPGKVTPTHFRQVAAAIVGSAFILFLAAVFWFGPNQLADHQRVILGLFGAGLAGLLTIALPGTIWFGFRGETSKWGRIAIRATGAIAIFVLVFLLLYHWLRVSSVKIDKDVGDIRHHTERIAEAVAPEPNMYMPKYFVRVGKWIEQDVRTPDGRIRKYRRPRIEAVGSVTEPRILPRDNEHDPYRVEVTEYVDANGPSTHNGAGKTKRLTSRLVESDFPPVLERKNDLPGAPDSRKKPPQ